MAQGYSHFKTVRVVRDSGPEKRVRETLGHLSRGWFPTHPDITRNIRRKLHDGEYRGDRDLLYHDLQGDLSLFTSCLTQMPALVADHGLQNGVQNALESLSHKQMEMMLDRSDLEISRFPLAKASAKQLKRLGRAVVTCHASEVIAQQIKPEDKKFAEDVFMTSLLLQLGDLLVSWNYPHIGSRLSKEEGADARDGHIRRVLGVSTVEIAQEYAKEWRLDHRILHTLKSSRTKSQVKRNSDEETAIILTSCHLGDRCAALNLLSEDEEVSRSSWDSFLHELTDVTGGVDSTLVREKLRDRCVQFLEKFSPYSRDVESATQMFGQICGARARKLFFQNNWVRQCEGDIRHTFESVYAELPDVGPSVPGLQTLMAEVLPLSGFTGGCIFIEDSDNQLLVPSLRFGVFSERYEQIPLYKNSAIVESRWYDTPYRDDYLDSEGGPRTRLTASLGNTGRAGVLVLELSHFGRGESNHNQLFLYRAIRQCIRDCLAI